MSGTSDSDIVVPDVGGAPVLIVEARYYSHINDMMLEGARTMLERAGAMIEHIVVPGALEIPTAIAVAHRSRRYAGFVAIGCVIRGETTHYELVSGESARGLMELGIREGIAIGNGILTVENEAQALTRADPNERNNGAHAALAALVLLDLRNRLQG